MDKLVALCKSRGFLFQSSEIYGGFGGFWDYGPLGVELKRNIKETWWRDMVTGHDELVASTGAPSTCQMVGIDCSIIMHPQVWKCSGHYDLFHDFMVDCRESKKRYRHDQVNGRWVEAKGKRVFIATQADGAVGLQDVEQRALKYFNMRGKQAEELKWDGELVELTAIPEFSQVLGPDAKEVGTLTPPREFNLMFETNVGALLSEDAKAFLRPETAQGIFVNFKNVMDSSRVKLPFGIAQMGKSFRNEITPKQFTFRSREFEQMEIEFFCHPDSSAHWYTYWRNRRFKWYVDLGLASDKLRLREHGEDERSHYSCGTADIEYAFPFLPPGKFGELEGIAHRGDFDLRSHTRFDPKGSKRDGGKLVRQGNDLMVEMGPDGKPRYAGGVADLTYLDEEAWERDKEKLGVKSFKDYVKARKDAGEAQPGMPYQFFPHVIEPSAGADRATLAFLCEAYCVDQVPDENGKLQERVVMKFHPRLAPIKAAVFPLVNKDGMPEKAQALYRELKGQFNVFYDDKGAVGRRYRRQDEAGTPFCITVDGDTLKDDTVTIRDRDSTKQWRVPIGKVADEIRARLK
ncbi:MAG: glycine--tRNA ligase [Gemmataceae bacterium]